MTQQDITKVSASILSCFLAGFYLNELRHTNIFKGALKVAINQAMNQLIKVERKYFNEIDKVDEKQMADKLIANKITFLEYLVKRYDYNDFSIMQEICVAYDLDPKRLKSISDKILLENGGTKV